MKIEPLITAYGFSLPVFRPEGVAASAPRSFTELFLQAVTGGQQRALNEELQALSAQAGGMLASPKSVSPQPYSSETGAQPVSALSHSLVPASATAEAHPASGPQAHEPLLETASMYFPPSSSTEKFPLSTEKFPLSASRTAPAGYAPALLASLSVNKTSGAVEVRLTPMTTVHEVEWLCLLKGAPIPNLLGQIHRQAQEQGISLENIQMTLADTDLPPPFAGKSLEELSRLRLPTEFYYTNPNGAYGSIGGQLPVTSGQRSTAFALIKTYV